MRNRWAKDGRRVGTARVARLLVVEETVQAQEHTPGEQLRDGDSGRTEGFADPAVRVLAHPVVHAPEGPVEPNRTRRRRSSAPPPAGRAGRSPCQGRSVAPSRRTGRPPPGTRGTGPPRARPPRGVGSPDDGPPVSPLRTPQVYPYVRLRFTRNSNQREMAPIAWNDRLSSVLKAQVSARARYPSWTLSPS